MTSFGLCLEACCEPDCELCDDVRNVIFMVELSGIVDGVAVPDPPTTGDCPACSSLNASYPLVYATGPGETVPYTSCSATTDQNFAITPCYYVYRELCGIVNDVDDSFANTFSIDLMVYVTNGGDRRGYLQVVFISAAVVPFPGTSATATHVVTKDFLLQAGSTTVASCLAIDVEDAFDVCLNTGSPSYHCSAPTDFILTAVEA